MFWRHVLERCRRCLLAIVVYRARDSLGAEPLYRIWLDYFRRFAGAFYRSGQVSHAVVSSSGIGIETAASATVSRLPGTIYKRVNELEQAIRNMRTEMDKVRTDTAEKFQLLDQRLTQEGEARASADKENQRLFASSLIGDSGWELAGVVFLVLGILCWGLPEELANLLW
jgi:hypothetical protein